MIGYIYNKHQGKIKNMNILNLPVLGKKNTVKYRIYFGIMIAQFAAAKKWNVDFYFNFDFRDPFLRINSKSSKTFAVNC